MPIFLALFRLIDHAASGKYKGVGILTKSQVDSLTQAKFLGVQIADKFTGAHSTNVKVLALVMVLAMTATTFMTQRQLMSKNMPADAMTGQYAQQQKMLLYVLPVVFAVGGIAFPIGVLFYWVTSNLWTMCQQFYVIRNNPAPGTPAAKAKQDRDAAKAARHGTPIVRESPSGTTDGTPTGAPGEADRPAAPEVPKRQQPKKQSRSQRKKQSPPTQEPKNQPGTPRPGPKRDGPAQSSGEPGPSPA
jgi:YidC/Oxa1 family membrane protein insertase